VRLLTGVIVGLLIILAGCAHHDLRTDGDIVILTLEIPSARSIQFASSLDGFELHQAKLIGGSLWEMSLPAGSTFSYFYIVDGEVYVPECRFSESDGFGSRNCIYMPGM
jgi:hypothetical protein